jgi:AcrR family transcriptional regulator
MLPDQTTHDRLLDATVAVVDAEGVKAVRVRDIAAVAGVREPSVYHYFGSRDGLIEAALVARYKRQLMQIIAPLKQLAAQCETRDEFKQMIRGVVASIVDPQRIAVRSVRADVIGSAQSRPALKEAIAAATRESNQGIADVISHGQSKGWVRDDINPLAFAVWYTGMVNGRILYEMDPQQCSALAWDHIALDATMNLLFGAAAK